MALCFWFVIYGITQPVLPVETVDYIRSRQNKEKRGVLAFMDNFD